MMIVTATMRGQASSSEREEQDEEAQIMSVMDD